VWAVPGNIRSAGAGGVAQVVECLPKKRKKERKKKCRLGLE
jgi:hypothetical protein